MQPTLPTLTVPTRFHGPRRSGNGGWTAGALAERLAPDTFGAPITVALRLPPPLDTPLDLEASETGVTAGADGRTVAQARFAAADLTPVPPVPADEAADAEQRYAGHESHPFPSCFACGTEREPGEGLRIFPGRVTRAAGADAADAVDAVDAAADVAATWTPYDVSVPIAWAALDCTGGWASGIEERPMVLGTITVRLERLPQPGQQHVVVGALRATEGRKTLTASSLYDSSGELVGTAEHVWIAVNPEDFQ